MANWLPASVANFITGNFLPSHACGWNFRQDLHLVELQLDHLKVDHHPERDSKLPYPAPPMVRELMPAIETFMREEKARHQREGMSMAVTRSSRDR
jgi:hypothetical protein